MQYREIVEVLNDIEKNVPITELNYKGLDVWPLIRLEIWRNLHQGKQEAITIDSSPQAKLGRLKSKILAYLEYIWRAIFTPYKEAGAVFLIARLERTVQVEDKYFSRFSNSLKEILDGLDIPSISLDLSRKKLPAWGGPVFIDREILAVSPFKKYGEIASWSELSKYIGRKYPTIKLGEDILIRNAEAILNYQKVFERILKKIKPKVCFLECWYHPTAMAYIRAARKLGIKTVEVQHGEQHGMYRSWSNVPKTGYDTMPNLWWCWGEESAKEINRWSSPLHPDSQAFVGGNPWIARFLDTRKNENKDERQNKNVLVALPNKELGAISNILEAFSNSPENTTWYFRLHPMQLTGGYKEKLEEELRKSGRSNFEIEKACATPLFDLLLNIDFLITPWSTVAYEALALGAHPVITLGNDRAVFEDYVNNGHFSFADTADKILETINMDKSQFNFKEETPYIETDKEKMKKFLSNLVSKNIGVQDFHPRTPYY